jgi:hypothetical protein
MTAVKESGEVERGGLAIRKGCLIFRRSGRRRFKKRQGRVGHMYVWNGPGQTRAGVIVAKRLGMAAYANHTQHHTIKSTLVGT